jgi:phage terminase small subunit
MIKLVQGNPGKRPLREDEPEAVVGQPHRPAALPRTARLEWKRLAALLESEHRLTLSDGPMLIGAALAYDAALEVRKKLKVRRLAADLWLRLKTGERMQWDQYRKFCNDLCLSPGTRARATTGGAQRPDAPVNPLEKFLNRKRG